MNLYGSETYINEISNETSKDIYRGFKDKNFLITGGTGLILSYLTDILLASSQYTGKIILAVRNIESAKQRFSKYVDDPRLTIIQVPLSKIDEVQFTENFDYVISGASITSPTGYAKYPVDVIMDNITGLQKLLEVAKVKGSRAILFSSSEVYGINQDDPLSEKSPSIFLVNEQRSCYNLAKAVCENLCYAYLGQYGVHFQILRLSRIFGPTMKIDDSKALSQFLKNALNNQDIVLRSKGDQVFNYQYVADTVKAVAYVLLRGKVDEVYNCTGNESISLKDLAGLIAGANGRNVTTNLGDDLDGKGYSKTNKSVLDVQKLYSLGFANDYSIKGGIINTLKVLKDVHY